jgi:chlorite dismutase
MDHLRRDPPATEEGWYVLHDLRTVNWDAWRSAPDHKRERALDSGVEFLREHEALEDVDGDAGGSAVFSVLGHKADLMVMHMRPTTEALDRAERRFEGTPFARFTDQVSSYVSVTEISGYMSEDLADGIENIEDAGRRNYMQSRLYPSIPDTEHVCFYPMDKRRDPEYNWYDLPFEERRELISGHGDIGREYAGKVTQIITGSVGFDDYEWGVTLFADDAVQMKKLLYEMRFDPSSSKYAEFGPFYFGRRFAPADLPALLAGRTVPTGTERDRHARAESAAGGASSASVTTVTTGGTADTSGEGNGHGHGDDRGHGHGDRDGNGTEARAHGSEGGADGHGDGGDDGDAAESGSGNGGGGGRPSRPDKPPHEVADRGTLERDVRGLGLGSELAAAGYGLVFRSEADAEDLVDDVDGLRGNFEHYDTHVATAVRADSGESVVVSLWANERAANVASGFLSDLPGVTSGTGAPLGEPVPDSAADSGEAATDDDGDGTDEATGAGTDAETHGTDDDDPIRGELADMDIYAGKPHGEDVYAIVVYSEADPETLSREVDDLREGFDRYDTHVRTALYEANGGDRTAVVSLWETQSAADTAGGYLSELPGVVARAGEESGFGTMGMFYTVKPDYRKEFVGTFGEVGGMLEDMEGHIDTRLMVNRDDENDMFISSQWDAREDAMAFFRSEAFRDTVQWGREVLADRPRHVFLA